MAGHTPWQEIKERAAAERAKDPEKQREYEQLYQELKREDDRMMALGDLRRARHLTQQELAELVGMSQPVISRLERQADLYLSTLRSYIEAMGGHLELAAVFPNARIPFTIGAIDKAAEEAERRYEAADEADEDVEPPSAQVG